MAGKKGMTHYPLEIREKIEKLNTLDGISFSQITQEFGVHESQIKSWCKWKRQYGIPKQMTGKKRGRSKVKIESLEEENKRLKMENQLLKKFNELLMEEETKRK